jgi:hypothetical protein
MIMIKTISSRYVLISITLAFILLTTLAIGNMGASYQESNTPNYGKIRLIADDNAI